MATGHRRRAATPSKEQLFLTDRVSAAAVAAPLLLERVNISHQATLKGDRGWMTDKTAERTDADGGSRRRINNLSSALQSAQIRCEVDHVIHTFQQTPFRPLSPLDSVALVCPTNRWHYLWRQYYENILGEIVFSNLVSLKHLTRILPLMTAKLSKIGNFSPSSPTSKRDQIPLSNIFSASTSSAL